MKKNKESWLIKGVIGFFAVSVVFVFITAAQATYITNYIKPVQVGLPVANTDAATKAYVDTVLSAAGVGLHVYNPATNEIVGDFIGFAGVPATSTNLQLNTCGQIVYLPAGESLPLKMTTLQCNGKNLAAYDYIGAVGYNDAACTQLFGVAYSVGYGVFATSIYEPGLGIMRLGASAGTAQKYYKNGANCHLTASPVNYLSVVETNLTNIATMSPCGSWPSNGCYVK